MSHLSPLTRHELAAMSLPFAKLQADAASEPAAHTVRSWAEISSEISRGTFWRRLFKSQHLPVDLNDFPITEYDDYRSAIEANSESNFSPLTNRQVLWWARSSGTSGEKRKLFPVTEPIVERRKIRRMLSLNRALQLLNDDSSEFRELRLGGTNPPLNSLSQPPIGHMTAFERTVLNEFTGNQALPPEIFSDPETLNSWISIFAISQDLTAVTTVTPTKLVWMLRDIEKNLDRYIAFLSDNRSTAGSIPAVPLNPRRIEILKSAVSKSSITVSDLWPSLQLIYTWKTASGRFLLNDLKPFICEPVKILQGHYISSESDFSLPSQNPNADCGPLNLLYSVTEFLKIGDPVEPKFLKKCWELEVGANYEIFVSNVMGLVRYRMRDIVCCRGFEGLNPLIEFRQKLDFHIDLEGCRIQYSELAEALGDSHFQHQKNWLYLPSTSRQHLVFLSADEDERTSLALQVVVDRNLQELNSEYRNLRSQGILEPIAIFSCKSSDSFWDHFPLSSVESKPPVMRNRSREEVIEKGGF